MQVGHIDRSDPLCRLQPDLGVQGHMQPACWQTLLNHHATSVSLQKQLHE